MLTRRQAGWWAQAAVAATFAACCMPHASVVPVAGATNVPLQPHPPARRPEAAATAVGSQTVAAANPAGVRRREPRGATAPAGNDDGGGDAPYEWVVTFAKQYGRYVSGMCGGQAELFAFDGVSGLPNASAALTNRFNNGTGVFGHGDANGDLRVTFDPGNDEYDFHVFDPGASRPPQSTPDFYWEGPSLPNSQHYRMEAHFVRVPVAAAVRTQPLAPAYTYDLVRGFNAPDREAAGFDSDNFSLTAWAPTQAQTFVVPAGVNRIIAAKAFCVRRLDNPRFTMNATIRRGRPGGPLAGPPSVSRQVFSNEFITVVMSWPLDAVRVTPGETLALVLASTDGDGFNVYATTADNYRNGTLHNGGVPVPGRDMVAVVVGVGVAVGA